MRWIILSEKYTIFFSPLSTDHFVVKELCRRLHNKGGKSFCLNGLSLQFLSRIAILKNADYKL